MTLERVFRMTQRPVRRARRLPWPPRSPVGAGGSASSSRRSGVLIGGDHAGTERSGQLLIDLAEPTGPRRRAALPADEVVVIRSTTRASSADRASRGSDSNSASMRPNRAWLKTTASWAAASRGCHSRSIAWISAVEMFSRRTSNIRSTRSSVSPDRSSAATVLATVGVSALAVMASISAR
jgi:hypothetical protein